MPNYLTIYGALLSNLQRQEALGSNAGTGTGTGTGAADRPPLHARLIARFEELRQASLAGGANEEEDLLDLPDWNFRAREYRISRGQGPALSAAEELHLLGAAMVRLEAGDFATCLRCGCRICDERLERMIWSSFCSHCCG